jgi:hypothetical protein
VVVAVRSWGKCGTGDGMSGWLVFGALCVIGLAFAAMEDERD